MAQSDFRINGFRQLEAFYSIVFNGKHDFTPHHISLYMFFFNQNNRSNWIEWFKCPYDLAMNGACIGSKTTYYKCLKDLKEWGLIDYIAGYNYKAPKIKLVVIKSVPNTVPHCEPDTEPNCEPITVLITVPHSEPNSVRQQGIYSNILTNKLSNLITNNFKLLKENNFNYDFFFRPSKNGNGQEEHPKKRELL